MMVLSLPDRFMENGSRSWGSKRRSRITSRHIGRRVHELYNSGSEIGYDKETYE